MSRTTEKDIIENPCKKFLKWTTVKETVMMGEGESAQEVDVIKRGTFASYNKDTKEKTYIDLPLSFAVLNKDLVAFKGYDEAKKRGVYSNEVSEPNHIVKIMSNKEVLLKFRKDEYKLNKDAVKGLNAKFTNSVYIAVNVGGEREIWNLQLSGAAFSGAPEDFLKPTEEEKKDGWTNFTNSHRGKALMTNMVEVKTYKTKKKGSSKFTIPVFVLGEEIDEEAGKEFDALDMKLKEYLDYYFSRPSIVAEEPEQQEVAEDSLDY